MARRPVCSAQTILFPTFLALLCVSAALHTRRLHLAARTFVTVPAIWATHSPKKHIVYLVNRASTRTSLGRTRAQYALLALTRTARRASLNALAVLPTRGPSRAAILVFYARACLDSMVQMVRSALLVNLANINQSWAQRRVLAALLAHIAIPPQQSISIDVRIIHGP